MNKFYAGIAATALAAAGLACGTGTAHAEGTPWALGYAPSDDATVSTAISDTTIYTAALNAGNTVDVTSTDRTTGATTHTVVSLAAKTGYTIGEYAYNASVAITSTGLVLVSTDQANDDAENGTDDDNGIWTAQIGSAATATATETISGLDDAGTLAVSADGTRAALTVGWEVYAFSPTATTTPSAVSLSTTDADEVTARFVAVANDGTLYVAGDDYANGYDAPSTPTLWTVGDGTASRTLADEPQSIALAGSKVLVGEFHDDSDDNETYALEVIDGQSATSIALPEAPDYLSAADNGLVAASDGWDVESLDLGKLGTYGDDNPVPHGTVSDNASVDAVIPTAETIYAVAQAEDEDGNAGDATIARVTKPGAVTTPREEVDATRNRIDVSWQAPAERGGADLSYVVTATDATTGTVITDQTTDTEDLLEASSGLVAGHTYAVSVRAENFAFTGDDVALPPALPGASTVAVSGNGVVGGTLTSTLTNKWPAGTHVSYEWFYSGGEYGGAIDNATGTTYTPTADHVGEQVGVIVTATKDGYSSVNVRSNVVKIADAAKSGGSAPAVAHVGSIKAPAIKSSAKKLTLKLAGVTNVPGKVKVYDGKKLIGKATVKNGKLTLKLKKHLTKGKHKITVKYAGSAQVAKFNKKVKLKVK